MTKIWLKKLIEKLNRSDGISIMAIVVLMLVMTVMGGVFTSIMGGWKISAPMEINSDKAFYLAETAAVFALQNAEDRFFGAKMTIGGGMDGTRVAPYVVSITGTAANGEIADYWIERPSQDGINVYDDDDNSVIIVSDSDTVKATKMRDDVDDDDTDDLNVAYDQNLDGISDRYTIIATGTVTRGGAVAARKQIKVEADIYRTAPTDILPGIHTISPIGGVGSGSGHLSIENTAPDPDLEVEYDNTGQVSGDESNLIYHDQPVLNADVFYAMADDQGSNHVKDLGYILNDTQNYPSNNFFYDAPTNDIPNYSYINGTLDIVGNRDVWGVVWVTGDVISDGTARIHGIIICFGNIVMNGGGTPATPQLDGGIIQYDNGSNSLQNNSGVELDIHINEGYFNALNRSIPIVDTVSWEEAKALN